MAPSGIKIPTLRSFFEEIPDRRFLIELKSTDPQGAELLCVLAREYDLTEQIMVGSFYRSVLVHFRQVCPEVPTSMAETEILRFFIFSKLGLDHLYNPLGYSIQVPLSYYGFKVVTPRFIQSARQLNLKVDVWTINDRDKMQQLLIMGVDGVITDRPDILKSLVDDYR
jgi:glycerophosphoryl diester phosphodiesterase